MQPAEPHAQLGLHIMFSTFKHPRTANTDGPATGARAHRDPGPFPWAPLLLPSNPISHRNLVSSMLPPSSLKSQLSASRITQPSSTLWGQPWGDRALQRPPGRPGKGASATGLYTISPRRPAGQTGGVCELVGWGRGDFPRVLLAGSPRHLTLTCWRS